MIPSMHEVCHNFRPYFLPDPLTSDVQHYLTTDAEAGGRFVLEDQLVRGLSFPLSAARLALDLLTCRSIEARYVFLPPRRLRRPSSTARRGQARIRDSGPSWHPVPICARAIEELVGKKRS